MNINKKNYEIYILGHYEGTLNKKEEQELQSFLINNPELKNEFDSFENFSISPDQDVKFDLKLALKQSPVTSNEIINDTNYQEYFIASVEGDLNTKQQNQLSLFLQSHSDLLEEYTLFNLSKLKPDTSIVYENKKQLKKFILTETIFNRKTILQTASIAASFLIIVSVALFINNTKVDTTNALSENKNTPPEINTEKNLASIINIPVVKHTIKNPAYKKDVITNKKETSKREDIKIENLEPKDNVQIELASNFNNNEVATRAYYNNVTAIANTYYDEENATNQKRNLKIKPVLGKFNPDEQLADVQDFFYNVANKGYARVETFTTGIKNTYRSIEQKLAFK